MLRWMRYSGLACRVRASSSPAHTFDPVGRSAARDVALPGLGGVEGVLPHMVDPQRPLRVLVVTKRHDAGTMSFAGALVDWLHGCAARPIQCFIEPTAAGPTGESGLAKRAPSVTTLGKRNWQDELDLLVVCGGDGTLLHAQTLFQGPAPPVVAFSCGSLGFLMPFKPTEARDVFERILGGHLDVLCRHRLQYTISHVADSPASFANAAPSSAAAAASAAVSHGVAYAELEGAAVPDPATVEGAMAQTEPAMQILNEVVIKRPHDFLGGVTEISCKIDGNELARFQGDGLIVASTTGSTAYSMATGGSIVHPSIDCILISPLCSMTLSSRPVILPGSATISLSPLQSAAFLEGRWGQRLEPRDVVTVTRSPYPIYTYLRSKVTSNWVADLSENLMYERQVRVHARDSPADSQEILDQFTTPLRL